MRFQHPSYTTEAIAALRRILGWTSGAQIILSARSKVEDLDNIISLIVYGMSVYKRMVQPVKLLVILCYHLLDLFII